MQFLSWQVDVLTTDLPAAVHGRHGQVGPVPAPHLAARRHGRPDPGLGPHPCRDHGDGRACSWWRGMSPLYELAPTAQDVVIIIGAITAFFAATVGLVQNDIKRVIAYSTCSQLGYMFVAMGVGAYGVGMFHLFTHAFFKALLFLGSGSVIHAMSDEQDMRKMGGLAPHIHMTWVMMLIGTLALTGFPLTAGYFSKDAIIEVRFRLACRSGKLRLRASGDRRLLHLILFLAAGLHDLPWQAARFEGDHGACA